MAARVGLRRDQLCWGKADARPRCRTEVATVVPRFTLLDQQTRHTLRVQIRERVPSHVAVKRNILYFRLHGWHAVLEFNWRQTALDVARGVASVATLRHAAQE